VTSTGQSRDRHPEFLRFLKLVARAYPAGEWRLVVDNYAAHGVRDWLAAIPRSPRLRGRG